MSDAIMVVLSNSNPARDAEFNSWYNDVHIVEVVKDLDGFESAQRFELAAEQIEESTQYRYLAIYRIKPGMLDVARSAVSDQRRERAEAAAAGREPKIKLDVSIFDGPHPTWFFESITDPVS
jgi:hypothetical protein